MFNLCFWREWKMCVIFKTLVDQGCKKNVFILCVLCVYVCVLTGIYYILILYFFPL